MPHQLLTRELNEPYDNFSLVNSILMDRPYINSLLVHPFHNDNYFYVTHIHNIYKIINTSASRYISLYIMRFYADSSPTCEPISNPFSYLLVPNISIWNYLFYTKIQIIGISKK